MVKGELDPRNKWIHLSWFIPWEVSAPKTIPIQRIGEVCNSPKIEKMEELKNESRNKRI